MNKDNKNNNECLTGSLCIDRRSRRSILDQTKTLHHSLSRFCEGKGKDKWLFYSLSKEEREEVKLFHDQLSKFKIKFNFYALDKSNPSE